MSIEEKLLADMKETLKKGDKLRLSTIRLARAAVKNKEIEQGKKLSDEDVIGVLSSLVKKHKEAIEHYKKGGRDDLLKKEEAEMAVMQEYLPKPLKEEEICEMVEKAIGEAEVKSRADFGKVMSIIMSQVKGRADGRMVKEIVLKRLG